MSDPKAVIAERGIDVPDGIDVNVVENSANTVHITMPRSPDGALDLSDEELSNAAGGLWTPAKDHPCNGTFNAGDNNLFPACSATIGPP